MLTINKPSFFVEEILETCISSFRESNPLKEKLNQCKEKIVLEENTYNELCGEKKFHVYPEVESIISILDSKEMAKIYDEKLVGGAARYFYDRLKLSVVDEKCPFCGQKNIKEIDHFLPKEKYATLALTPINLIPICKDCNFIKKSHVPSTYEEILFNPYFDDFNEEKWLVASISKSLPVRVKFKVNEDSTINENDRKRIETTFNLLDLGQIYRIEANTEIGNMKFSWKRVYASKGSEALHQRLLEDAESRKEYRKNSWQTALYEALSTSPWFYNELIKNL
ncbi:HNH endonuclease signature motif containing protein [Lysinibacillus sp. FSL M8-0216]|uniref:HNH endonuclease signature motif containing protein n=1 Tax=Lysinibacillus sp. FSL M8-0216 TaxID=2921619 RepID=UPI00315A310E